MCVIVSNIKKITTMKRLTISLTLSERVASTLALNHASDKEETIFIQALTKKHFFKNFEKFLKKCFFVNACILPKITLPQKSLTSLKV